MRLGGLHLLLTYQCNLECEHCFVWGSPRQRGVMNIGTVRRVLEGAARPGTVDWIFFEGGEPFLYYATLLAGVRASKELGIPAGYITIAHPEDGSGRAPGESRVMYRGRAARRLAHLAEPEPWSVFTECPHEDLREPGRLHLDPLGNLHICQGISVGNLFDASLDEILEGYDTKTNPITGPLEEGGPAKLVRDYGLVHREGYADACHLCYEARVSLRPRFGEILGPDQMYGRFGEE